MRDFQMAMTLVASRLGEERYDKFMMGSMDDRVDCSKAAMALSIAYDIHGEAVQDKLTKMVDAEFARLRGV